MGATGKLSAFSLRTDPIQDYTSLIIILHYTPMMYNLDFTSYMICNSMTFYQSQNTNASLAMLISNKKKKYRMFLYHWKNGSLGKHKWQPFKATLSTVTAITFTTLRLCVQTTAQIIKSRTKLTYTTKCRTHATGSNRQKRS